MSTAAVFLDTEKDFDTTWNSGLLYKLSELQFSTSLIELSASFLTDEKFEVLVEGEFSTPRQIAAGVPQGSILAPILCSLYINDNPAVGRVLQQVQVGNCQPQYLHIPGRGRYFYNSSTKGPRGHLA
jgi:hypothetical protein